MRNASFDQLELDGADAAVVHVRGRDAVRASVGVGHGDIADAVDGECVVETTVITQDATVAVRGIFAEADIGNDEEVGERAAEEPNRLDYRTLWIICGGPERIFGAGRDGYAEEYYGL